MDETVVKMHGLRACVWSAVDVYSGGDFSHIRLME